MCSEVLDSSTMKLNYAKWATPRCRAEHPTLPLVGMITKIPLQKFRQTDASKVMTVRLSLLQAVNFSKTEVIRDY